MAAPGNGNGAGGMLNGHGVGIAMAAIFVGMGLVVAVAASDGAILGLNFSSASDNGAPVSDTGGAGALSRDVFDEGSDVGNVTSTASERNATLSEEERRLLAMGDFYWDPIAGRYIAAGQDIMDKFDQQNFTRPEPAQPRSEEIFVDDRDRDREDETIEIEEPQDDAVQQDDASNQGESETDNSGSGSVDGGDQSGESGSGDSGSGSNSTSTNSTSTQDSGSGDSGNGTSGNGSGIEASISIG